MSTTDETRPRYEGAPDRNDTPERNDVRAGDRFAYFQSTAGYAYANATAMHARPDVAVDAWGVTLADGTPGVMHLGVAKWWRRISPAPAAPKERVLAPGWTRYTSHGSSLCMGCKRDLPSGQPFVCGDNGMGNRCAPCAEAAGAYVDVAKPVERRLADGWRRLESSCTHRTAGEYTCPQNTGSYLNGSRGACEAHAAEMGVFADARPVAMEIDPKTGRDLKDIANERAPLTFDEANPRPGKAWKNCPRGCQHEAAPECGALRDGRRLDMKRPCGCVTCHRAEAKRAPKVVGKYDDHFARFENAGRPGMAGGVERCAWSAMQLGRAPGIDSERVKRPVGKVRPEYLEEVDVDFVGLLDADVRR